MNQLRRGVVSVLNFLMCISIVGLTGCKTETVLQTGSAMVQDDDVLHQRLMSRLQLGQSEDEVVRIMGSKPVSRWEEPDFNQVVCFWFYSRTDYMPLKYAARSYWLKFEDGKLVGISLKAPKYVVGDVVFSLDARWHYRKTVYPLMCKMFYKKQGQRLFFNDDSYCYVVGGADRIVDHWDGKTCHWQPLPVKPGCTRVYSPDKVYSIDVPNDKIASYIGNGRFRLVPKDVPVSSTTPTSANNSSAGNAALEIAGVLLGAFVEGAAEGLSQGLADGVANSITKGKHHGGYVPSVAHSGGGSGNTGKKTSVKPRVKHSSCGGTGICPICRGRGSVGNGIRCTGCGGSKRCRACHGSGWAN